MTTFAARIVSVSVNSWISLRGIVLVLSRCCSNVAPFFINDNLLFVLNCDYLEVLPIHLFLNGPYFKYYAVFWRF